MTAARLRELKATQPPVFRINLSLPPEERYKTLARLYKDKLHVVTDIFDEVIHNLAPKLPTKPIHWMARMCLRKLYTKEETAEIRGISHVTGIDLYFLISFNVVLDLLMGCTSGGVRMHDGLWTRMVHFRTLDWGMDALRDLIVQLEYIRDDEPDNVLASCITYVGFVGVLTGVRKGLSVSLNFRAVHDSRRDRGFYWNHLLVFLGFRQSVTSLLRQIIIPGSVVPDNSLSNTSTIWDVIVEVPGMRTTAAYLIFCDGSRTMFMEKDYESAVWRTSTSFLIKTNHDEDVNTATAEAIARDKGYTGLRSKNCAQSMAEVFEQSRKRQESMQLKWESRVQDHKAFQRQKRIRRATEAALSSTQPLHLRWKRNTEGEYPPESETEVSATLGTVLGWLCADPIVNRDTHYAVLMDPVEGRFIYAGQFPAQTSRLVFLEK
ncbi:uncharacterized protein N7515_000947 [Penicillium bovifimosum]|uniref:ceramidase n=1 Tax=Penicillium bovifimosum TaxID=126998 RepID=A0A9W9HGS8_9EURO|nr:uncharacterized protein N7515_000947 [Penicillium bovifimosum]KAJ5146383.1 hypothetical protein N7515_000947 [Penicillium bovifimosum]